MNLVGRDPEHGPVLVSIKTESIGGQEHWRVLLRLRTGSTHMPIPASDLGPNPSPVRMVKVRKNSKFKLSSSQSIINRQNDARHILC